VCADRRRTDPQADDPFLGLYLTDEAVERILTAPTGLPAVPKNLADAGAALAREEAEAESVGTVVRLQRLRRDAGLRELDITLLLVALAPDVDARFERFYGYLNDDITRRRASVGLALELAGCSTAVAEHRARLRSGNPLIDLRLVEVEDPDRPFLTRALRVPDRVTAHLLGDDRPEPGLPEPLGPDPQVTVDADALGAALARGIGLVFLRQRSGGLAIELAVEGLLLAGRTAYVVGLDRIDHDGDAASVVGALVREAILRGAGLVVGPIDSLGDRTGTVLSLLSSSPVPVLLFGAGHWDPAWTSQVPLVVEAPVLSRQERGTLWRHRIGIADDERREVVDSATHLDLAPDQIARAAKFAIQQADLDGSAVSVAHIQAGARAQNAAGLQRLARRIEPDSQWQDLVLPDVTIDALRELASRARHREQVLGEWRMRPGGGRGRGVTGVFAGDSGTGKTMSAEVLAGELGLDLYTVNLATVVDKYVGETEKNLERIFTEAAGCQVLLLFDEADVIFGKRTEVKDARDRYANLESAYLLQRIESFDGLAVLTTNLRANLDDAFTRRFDMVIEFLTPDETLRLRLWDACLGTEMPRGKDVDLDTCARQFDLSGGNIRSAAVTAAYLAAAAGRPLSMADLVRAVEREYRKLGRLCIDGEFDLVRPRA
jgi:hypothetical protein